MKKILPLFLLIFLCSCVLDNSTSQVGYVTLSPSTSRGVSASIDYPSLLDRTWTVTATNSTTTLTFEDYLLTDSLGPFAVGSWTFTITDSNNLYTGSITTNIKPGTNNLNITLHSTSNKGTLSVEECSFLESKVGKINYVDCYVDDSRVNGTEWVVSSAMTEDNDYYILPTISLNLAEGIHTLRLYYGANNGGFSSETISFRVVNGMTTHISIGEHEGNLTINVGFDVVEALV